MQRMLYGRIYAIHTDTAAQKLQTYEAVCQTDTAAQRLQTHDADFIYCDRVQVLGSGRPTLNRMSGHGSIEISDIRKRP